MVVVAEARCTALTLSSVSNAVPTMRSGSLPERSTASTTPENWVEMVTPAPVASLALILMVYWPSGAVVPSDFLPSPFIDYETGLGVAFLEIVAYNSFMGRPRKDGRLLMDTDLRVPLTSEQKAILEDATSDEPEGKAAWARTILLRAARTKISGRMRKEASPRSKG